MANNVAHLSWYFSNQPEKIYFLNHPTDKLSVMVGKKLPEGMTKISKNIYSLTIDDDSTPLKITLGYEIRSKFFKKVIIRAFLRWKGANIEKIKNNLLDISKGFGKPVMDSAEGSLLHTMGISADTHWKSWLHSMPNYSGKNKTNLSSITIEWTNKVSDNYITFNVSDFHSLYAT